MASKHHSKLMDENDYLGLATMIVPDIPKDILFPEELNQYLHGQIQFLTHSNGMLQKDLSEKEMMLENNQSVISNLTAKVSEYERFTKNLDGPYTGNTSHLMGAKIVELSKKLRDKTSEAESLKTKYSKLQQKLQNLENIKPKEDVINCNNHQQELNSDQEKIQQLSEELKNVQEKLTQTTNKLFEAKNNNIQLKNELKSANKILQQELGDCFTSVQQLTNTQSNWRGRAQQILSLQQKNSDLHEKLTSLSEKELVSSASKTDNRKQVIEQLQKELNSVRNELEDTKKKMNAARARVKVLETDCFSMKCKVNAMTNKNEHDDQLIKILSNQIASMEEANNGIRKEKQIGKQKLEEENNNLKIDLAKDKCVIENLKSSLDEKDNKIKVLQNELQCARTSFEHNNFNNFSTNANTTQDLHKLNVLQVEVDRLLELVSVLNNRLDNERCSHSETQISYRRERQKAAKLEHKLSRIELEYNLNKTQSYSSKSLLKSSSTLNGAEENSNLSFESLKNSLELAEENLSVLKTRLDIVQKEKELDLQKFSSILLETSGLMKKYNSNVSV